MRHLWYIRRHKMKETKLLHLQVVGGDDPDFIKLLGKHLNKIKENLNKQNFPYNLEFIITTERIELHSVKYLIDELYSLYKKEQKILDIKRKALKDEQTKASNSRGSRKNRN